MLRGLDPWRQLLLERENPRTLFGKKPGNITGANLNLDSPRIAANRCHCNQDGAMTLMQWVWMFWHDLAAPVMVGVLTGLILGWWRSRK